VNVWRVWAGRGDVRALHPPLLAVTCHVLLLGVDGWELRTLGVVGVARRIMRTLHPPLLAVTCHVLLLGVDGLGFRTLGVVGVHGAHREGRGGRTSTMGGARHAAERCEHEDQRVEAGVAATE